MYLFCYALLCVQSRFAIILKRKRKLVALLLFLQMYFYYKWSVALPRHAVGWSAVCDCGISDHMTYFFQALFSLTLTTIQCAYVSFSPFMNG